MAVCSFLYAFEIKDDYMKVEESKKKTELQDSEQNYLPSRSWVFQRCVTLRCKKQWTRLAKRKDKSFTKLYTHPACPFL